MALHTTRVGLHARNAVQFTEQDYYLVSRARIETLKMMSLTEPAVFDRLRRSNPSLEFIVRLYDDRLSKTSRPSPSDFVNRMVPVVESLRPYTEKYEIHNEPNHVAGIEGWGASDDNARSFRAWYQEALKGLKEACPWAKFGFPGLALNAPHRDLEWLEICKDVIRASDWLGCHCYWQGGNMLNDQWGLRFKLYHARFPNKLIEITEFGNSTPNLSADTIAHQYVSYYTELHRYPYLGSASAFIASSPDPTWGLFVWMKDGGELLPVVHAVGDMERRPAEVPNWPTVTTPVTAPVTKPPVTTPPVTKPPVTTPPVTTPPATPVTPEPELPSERVFAETGKTVRGSFLRFYEQYGVDICGWPITEQIDEAGRPAQYFQRVGLEELKTGKIRLKLVGTEAWEARQQIAALEKRLKEMAQQPPSCGVSRPPIEDITDKLLVHPTNRYPTRSLSDIQQVVIHHTATSPTITPQRLAEFNVQKLGRPGIAYHFVVAADGTIYQTNKLETVSEHAFTHSADSVGVVFAGNFTEAIPTDAQLKAGGQLVAWLLSTLRLVADKVVGLGELVNTQSPGKQWLAGQRWKEKLLAQAEEARRAGGGEDQSQVVAALRAEVASLQAESAALKAEIERLQRQPAPSTPPAAPAPGGQAPDVQDITAQLPANAAQPYPSRALTDIKQIVIHHTGTAPTITPQRLADAQVRQRNKPGIAYHYFVGPDGTIYQTNKLETVSDHAFARNADSVGVVFPGDFSQAIPTDAQLQAGGRLVAWLLTTLHLSPDNVVGLGEFVNTQSPGKQWLTGQRWKDKLLAAVQENLAATSTPPAQDQSATIAALRAEIAGLQARAATLQAEIERLRRQPAPIVVTPPAVVEPPPTPHPPVVAPGSGKVARPVIQDMIAQLPVHPTKRYNKRPLKNIKMLVVHHSAVAPTVGPQRMAAYHVKNEDWPGLGYHFMVGADGVIYQGNSLETVSYHAVQANPYSVGICFLGNFNAATPPAPQLEAGARLVAWLMQDLNIALDEIKGHQEVVATVCPGTQWLQGKKWKNLLRQEVIRIQQEAQQPPAAVTPPAGAAAGRDGKPLDHYMLFWQRADAWPRQDWLNAQAYIGAFRPTTGFSINDASLAEYVTIVGGPLGISKQTEDWLKAAGCRVDRIAGKDEADTKRILDDLAARGKRFLSFEG